MNKEKLQERVNLNSKIDELSRIIEDKYEFRAIGPYNDYAIPLNNTLQVKVRRLLRIHLKRLKSRFDSL